MTVLFRGLQLVSSALFSFGSWFERRSQKVAGLIAALLVANNYLEPGAEIPFGVLVLCYAVIGLGTLCGEWQVKFGPWG